MSYGKNYSCRRMMEEKDNFMKGSKDGQENSFRKYLYNEVTAVVALVAVTFGVVNWVNNPAKEMEKNIALIQKDIEIINTNHITHIQDILLQIKDIKEKEIIQDTEIKTVELEVRETLTLLKQHIK